MDKKNLLILSPGFPQDESDTRCIPAMQLFLEELKRRDLFNLVIITLHYPYKAKEYEWKGLKVYALGGDNKKGVSRIQLLIKAMLLARKLHKKTPFDQVHSFWLGQCAWIANRLSKRWGVKHSCTLMGQDVLKENAYLKKVKPLPQLIALSDFQASRLEQDWNIKPELIIPWGTYEYTAETPPRTIDVLGVGNLTKLKSFDQFIRIIGQLKENFPSIQSAIIGEGDQSQIQAKLKEKGLESNVKLLGIKNREEVLKLMAQSKCLLHCSSFESFGMVLIEALDCGAAVFSKPVGIAPEIKEIQLYEEDEQAVQGIASVLQQHTFQKSHLFPVQSTVDSYINSVF